MTTITTTTLAPDRCEYGHWYCISPCAVRCVACGQRAARTFTDCGNCGAILCQACDTSPQHACTQLDAAE